MKDNIKKIIITIIKSIIKEEGLSFKNIINNIYEFFQSRRIDILENIDRNFEKITHENKYISSDDEKYIMNNETPKKEKKNEVIKKDKNKMNNIKKENKKKTDLKKKKIEKEDEINILKNNNKSITRSQAKCKNLIQKNVTLKKKRKRTKKQS